ncbi:MAG: inorganic diphosphatase [Flavobacteriales bacterium]|nr:inorganic diphosphatase [Flavobacteriales bacterium]
MPRRIAFLPYPANYGFIPGTRMDKAQGGDGDALDVFVLCATQPSGTVMEVEPIGIIELLDAGERDDKIIALPVDRTLLNMDVDDIHELLPPPGSILVTWLLNYDPMDGAALVGVRGRKDARPAFGVGRVDNLFCLGPNPGAKRCVYGSEPRTETLTTENEIHSPLHHLWAGRLAQCRGHGPTTLHLGHFRRGGTLRTEHLGEHPDPPGHPAHHQHQRAGGRELRLFRDLEPGDRDFVDRSFDLVQWPSSELVGFHHVQLFHGQRIHRDHAYLRDGELRLPRRVERTGHARFRRAMMATRTPPGIFGPVTAPASATVAWRMTASVC